MSALAAAVLFAGGVYLALRLIGALYRIVDVWFAIGPAWPAAVARTLGWAAAAAAVAWLAGPRRAAVGWGMAAYLAFYLGAHAVWPLVVRGMARRHARLPR